MSQYPPPTVIVASTKSVALSLVLTFFFGPLGMLYSTIWGAIVMILLSVPAFIITLGHAAFLIWPVSMIWEPGRRIATTSACCVARDFRASPRRMP